MPFKVFGSVTLWVLEISLCTVGNYIRSRGKAKVLDKPVNVCQIWHLDFMILFHVNNISNVLFSDNCSFTLEGKMAQRRSKENYHQVKDIFRELSDLLRENGKCIS